jgi:hypothetical protein
MRLWIRGEGGLARLAIGSSLNQIGINIRRNVLVGWLFIEHILLLFFACCCVGRGGGGVGGVGRVGGRSGWHDGCG